MSQRSHSSWPQKLASTTKGNTAQAATSRNQSGNPTQSAFPPTTVVVQEPAEDPAAHARAEQREERNVLAAEQNARAAERMATLTALLILATSITLAVIGWQAWETRQAADAARKSIAQSERHFELLNAQWLDVSFARVQAIQTTDQDVSQSGRAWLVRFKITNNTPLPVRITSIEVVIEGDRTTYYEDWMITPRKDFRPKIRAAAVAPQTAESIAAGRPMGVRLFARISYINAFDRRGIQYFARYGTVATWKETRLKNVMPGDHAGLFETSDTFAPAPSKQDEDAR